MPCVAGWTSLYIQYCPNVKKIKYGLNIFFLRAQKPKSETSYLFQNRKGKFLHLQWISVYCEALENKHVHSKAIVKRDYNFTLEKRRSMLSYCSPLIENAKSQFSRETSVFGRRSSNLIVFLFPKSVFSGLRIICDAIINCSSSGSIRCIVQMFKKRQWDYNQMPGRNHTNCKLTSDVWFGFRHFASKIYVLRAQPMYLCLHGRVCIIFMSVKSSPSCT